MDTYKLYLCFESLLNKFIVMISLPLPFVLVVFDFMSYTYMLISLQYQDMPIQYYDNLFLYHVFVSPELSSVRDYVITHSVRSMYVVCMYVVCM